jgi:hypothetical protein
VLIFLKTHPFSQYETNEKEECIKIWSAWSALFEKILRFEHLADGGMHMVMALGREDEDAVWHAYGRWVYLAAEIPKDEIYEAMVLYLKGSLPLTPTRNFGTDAWDRGFNFWYAKAAMEGFYLSCKSGRLIDIAGICGGLPTGTLAGTDHIRSLITKIHPTR